MTRIPRCPECFGRLRGKTQELHRFDGECRAVELPKHQSKKEKKTVPNDDIHRFQGETW